ncbi:hypothetical protein L540_02720 [Bordetella pseudohinzii]|nr:hypothetical protein L540_02720 [Bordetella pseudohinzii]
MSAGVRARPAGSARPRRRACARRARPGWPAIPCRAHESGSARNPAGRGIPPMSGGNTAAWRHPGAYQ